MLAQGQWRGRELALGEVTVGNIPSVFFRENALCQFGSCPNFDSKCHFLVVCSNRRKSDVY